MKIRVTEIEADARELRECNSLADNVMGMLSRCFQSHEPFEDEAVEGTEECEENRND